MPYISVTDELRKIIKDERKRNNITSEQLASSISKSRVYVSQLENGRIPFITSELFKKIIQSLNNLDEKGNKEYIEDLLKRISIPVNLDLVEKEEWMFIVDLQIREFKVPQNILNFVTTKCDELGLTYEEIIEEINKNKNLPFASTLEPNEIKIVIQQNTINTAIRFQLDKNYIREIIEGKIKYVNYINLKGIIYNIYLLINNTEDEAQDLSEKLLEDNEIITILKRNRKEREIIKNKQASGEIFDPEEDGTTQYDRDFAKYFKKTVSYLKDLNNIRPNDAPDILLQINRNFYYDPKLMFAIMSLPYDKLTLPFNTRKEFFDKIKYIFDEYLEKAGASLNQTEDYI